MTGKPTVCVRPPARGAALLAVLKAAPRKVLGGVRYAFHVIVHPFDGFYDLKHEKRGNAGTATLIVAVLILVMILQRQFTGFVVNTARPKDLNILSEVLTVLLPLGLWVVSNWCLTTLTEGEGSFRDIYIYTCYSLLPLILVLAPLILFSRSVTTESVSIYNFLTALAFVWAGLLLLTGTLVTHQFTLGKTIFTIVIVVIGMCVIAFLGLLVLNIVEQIRAFASEVYYEYVLRI